MALPARGGARWRRAAPLIAALVLLAVPSHEAPETDPSRGMRVTIRFVAPPGDALLDDLEARGVRFLDFGRGPAGSRTIYPARVTAGSLSGLQDRPAVHSVHPAPRPMRDRTLARARSEVQADAVWESLDARGIGITGEGILIADIESAPDPFHPFFFRADGGRFAWLDRDGSGDAGPGDAVDLDGDGVADPDETLGWIRLLGPGLERDTTRFLPDLDFLYQDADGSGTRESGPPRFSEGDPSYGERLFLADDTDGDGVLEPGESLLGLGSSRIRAMRSGAVYRRGENLIEAPGRSSHATAVCGILAGGWAGRHRLTGIAPGAEILVSGPGPGDVFVDPVEALLWARDEGADVVLFELRGRLTDGTSHLDRLVNELVAEGLIFVAAAGNERYLQQHILFEGSAERIFAGDRRVLFVFPEEVPPVLSVAVSDTVLHLATETGTSVGYAGVSFRGEPYLALGEIAAFRLSGSFSPEDTLRFRFPGFTGTAHGYSDAPGLDPWNGLGFPDRDGKYTVTSPGVADSAITVGAADNDATGRIAWFSGEGPRWDGARVVDITAPGVRVLAPDRSPERVIQFSGTSAAVPFVAGAAALLKQMFPDLDSGGFRSLLRAGAARDSLTFDPDHWGAGRLRIHDALVAGLEREVVRPGAGRIPVRVSPNPVRGPATLAWPAGSAAVEVRVVSVTGRLVWRRDLPPTVSRVVWPGVGEDGLPAASGVYFAHVKTGTRIGVARIVRTGGGP